MDGNSLDQRADRLAVTQVDPDVLEAAPDDQVANPPVRAAGEPAAGEPGLVATDAAVAAADQVEQLCSLERVVDESDAVEYVRAFLRPDPRVTELVLGDAVHAARFRLGGDRGGRD